MENQQEIPQNDSKKEMITIEVTRYGNGKLRQIELSKKEWSLTRESLDRWLFTEVKS